MPRPKPLTMQPPKPYDVETFLAKHGISRKEATRILDIHRFDKDASDRAARKVEGNHVGCAFQHSPFEVPVYDAKGDGVFDLALFHDPA